MKNDDHRQQADDKNQAYAPVVLYVQIYTYNANVYISCVIEIMITEKHKE